MKGNSVTEEGDKTKTKDDKVKNDKIEEVPKEKILTASESQRNIGEKLTKIMLIGFVYIFLLTQVP